MKYKGFYIKISPDSNIRRVDKKGRYTLRRIFDTGFR